MKTQIQKLFLALLLFNATLAACAQGTAFSYQGRLNENGIPASGSYDLQFSLRDAAAAGSPVGGTNTIAPVSVSNGLFTVMLDFGAGVFTGGDRWLEIGVKSNGVAGAHTPLTPRQPLTPSPYAIFAGGAQMANTVATGSVSGASLAVGAVNSGTIADGTIQPGDLSVPLLNSTFWRLNGNTGTTPGVSFLGTTDNQALELRVNGARAFRLEPNSSDAPNLIGGFNGNQAAAGVIGAIIAGGGASNLNNVVAADYASVLGGISNVASGVQAVIGGGGHNLASGPSAFVGGGDANSILPASSFGFIGGGQANTIASSANHSFIGGGSYNTNSGGGAFIGGGIANRAEHFDAVVAGGGGNVNAGYRAFIGSGEGNSISNGGPYATIGGGIGGINVGYAATIAGGYYNTVTSNSAAIGGGGFNFASGVNSVVAGGSYNRNTAQNAAIGGGEGNVISNIAPHSVIAGGIGNRADAGASFTGGGSYNVNNSPGGVIGGGFVNRTENFDAVVVGGGGNLSAGYRSFIGSGEGNTISNSAPQAAIVGGYGNRTSAGGSFTGGGGYNTNNGPGGVIGGGYGNRTENYETVIAGGVFNFNAGYRAYIGGGEGNSNSSTYSVIGGGLRNWLQPVTTFSTIGGGWGNTIQSGADESVIAGGNAGLIQGGGRESFIGGGYANTVQSNAIIAFVGGGAFNTNGGYAGMIGGGERNFISGSHATIPGGYGNSAGGFASFAAGFGAKAFHYGSFVWADGQGPDFPSTANNQFSVRANGGVRLVTSGAGMTLDGQPVLSGTIGSAQLANGSVVRSLNSLTDAVTLIAGTNVTITPSGNTLQIAATFLGPVSDNQLSANIARLNAAAVFTGPVTVNNAASSFNGAFAGNGGGLTNINAATLQGNGAGSFWQTSGNAGTSGANFVGTTDNQALVLKVNDTQGLRIEPATNNGGTILPNLIGGAFNTIQGGESGSIIAGGRENALQSTHAVISGGWRNRIQSGSLDSAIVGGQANVISNAALGATIGGGVINSIGAAAEYASVSGGRFNRVGANALNATIGGGRENSTGTNSSSATIGGGYQNSIDYYGINATIGGGAGNAIQGYGIGVTIGGGSLNGTAFDAEYATISGGTGNNAGGYGSTISGGENNAAGGNWSMVSGGFGNAADGNYSFAAGYRGKALHHSAFVWADSAGGDFASTGANQFLIRASGGVGLGTSNPVGKLHLYSADNPTVFRIQSTGTPGFGRIEFVSNPQGDPFEWRPAYIQSIDVGNFTGGLAFFVNGTGSGSTFGNTEVMRMINGNVGIASSSTLSFGAQTRQMLNLWGTQYGIGVQASTLYSRCNSGGPNEGFSWYKGGVHNDNLRNAGGGAELMHLDVTGLIVNGAIVLTSDRNAKENFAPVTPREVLEKVAAMPITSWNFKQDGTTRHIGPMAQDFHAAFGLGTDDKHIATVDADGVALAAIQGLNQRLTDELKRRDAENTELKQRLENLEQLVNANLKGER